MARRFLIVDDDPESRDLYARALSTYGIDVLEAGDGESALQLLGQTAIHGVILDILLPDISGFEVAKRLRAMAGGYRKHIIFATGVYIGQANAEDALARYKAHDYLFKPISPGQLLKSVGALYGEDWGGDEVETADPLNAGHAVVAEQVVMGEPVPDVPFAPEGADDMLATQHFQRNEVDAVLASDLIVAEPIVPPGQQTAQPRPAKVPYPEVPPATLTHTEPDFSWSTGDRRFVSDASNALSEGGAIADTSVAQLLVAYARSAATGTLAFSRGKKKKVILFEQGRPIQIRSNQVSECLGRILESDGMISRVQREDSLAQMKAKNQLHGEVLLAMNLLTPEQLEQSLKMQLMYKTRDLLGWTEGYFKYSAELMSPPKRASSSVVIDELIFDAVLNGLDIKRVDYDLQSYSNQCPAFVGQNVAEPLLTELDHVDRHFLDRLDGYQPLNHVLADAPLDNDRARRLVLAFTHLGAIGFHSPMV